MTNTQTGTGLLDRSLAVLRQYPNMSAREVATELRQLGDPRADARDVFSALRSAAFRGECQSSRPGTRGPWRWEACWRRVESGPCDCHEPAQWHDRWAYGPADSTARTVTDLAIATFGRRQIERLLMETDTPPLPERAWLVDRAALLARTAPAGHECGPFCRPGNHVE